MLDRADAERALTRLFNRQTVADLPCIKKVLGTNSRATVSRILSDVGYLTSYSHTGRYYTLDRIPRFDGDGLWVCGEILFSKHRTLRSTIVHFVDAAPAGQTHAELQGRLHIRVQDTLCNLLEDQLIGRTTLEDLYVYVSSNRPKAQRQISARRKLLREGPKNVSLPNRNAIIDVLHKFIQHPREDPVTLATLLESEGKHVSLAEIQAVFEQYGLGKKKRPRGTGGPERREVPPRRGTP
jgi:hypothetical protein